MWLEFVAHLRDCFPFYVNVWLSRRYWATNNVFLSKHFEVMTPFLPKLWFRPTMCSFDSRTEERPGYRHQGPSTGLDGHHGHHRRGTDVGQRLERFQSGPSKHDPKVRTPVDQLGHRSLYRNLYVPWEPFNLMEYIHWSLLISQMIIGLFFDSLAIHQ